MQCFMQDSFKHSNHATFMTNYISNKNVLLNPPPLFSFQLLVLIKRAFWYLAKLVKKEAKGISPKFDYLRSWQVGVLLDAIVVRRRLSRSRFVVFSRPSAFQMPSHTKFMVIDCPVWTHNIFTPSKAVMKGQVGANGTLHI